MNQHNVQPTQLTASDPRVAQRPVQQAWIDFLGRYEWRFFATLTSRYPNTSKRLVSEFRRFIRRLERISKGDVSWFYAIESGRSGIQHIHALIAPSVALPAKILEAEWRLGFSHIRTFDPLHGASYVVKEFGP